MPRTRVTTHATNGGELSRRLEGRSDLDGIYDRGFARMFNFLPTVEGPAVKRPGTIHVAQALPTASRIERFIFNTAQAYVIECGELKARFYTNGGQIESAPGVPLEVDVPYTAAQWPHVSFEQSFDRIYLTHPAHPPAALTRIGAEQFEYEVLELKNGPFKATNTDKTKTIAVTSATSTFDVGDSATIEATGHAPFDEGMIGSPVLLEAVGFTDIMAWEPNVKNSNLSVGDLRRSEGKVYRCTAIEDSDGRTGSIQPTHTEGTEWDGSGQPAQGTTDDFSGVEWEYVHDRFGIGIITAVADSSTATIEVTRRIPEMMGGGTWKWALGAFSDYEQWPHLAKLWGGRLCFFKGIEIFASVSNDYGGGQVNFAPFNDAGELSADMAFRRIIAISDPPIWGHADKDYLLLGCARQEVVIGLKNRTEGVSSSNLDANPQSAWGSAPVWPVQAGGSIVFAQRGGRKVRELEYTFERERFTGLNLNIYARHVTSSGLSALAFQQETEEMLWGVRSDGKLVAHPRSAEQATKGFARAALAGDDSYAGWLTTIPSDDGETDDLWILASLGGTRHILKLAPYWDEDLADSEEERVDLLKSAVFVDFAVTYDGSADGTGEGAKQLFTSGLTHLEGQVVRVLADGLTVDGLTVSGGELELNRPATKVVVGLGYEARLKPMRAEVRGQGGSAQGLLAKVKAMFARLIDTTDLTAEDSDGNSNRMFAREAGTTQMTTPRIFNGDSARVAVGSGSSRNPSPEFVSDDAGPCTITLFAGDYELEDPRG